MARCGCLDRFGRHGRTQVAGLLHGQSFQSEEKYVPSIPARGHPSINKMAGPGDSPAPFTLTEGVASELIEVGGGHYVRAAANSRPEVLLS